MKAHPAKVPFPMVTVLWTDTECNPRWADAAELPGECANLLKCPVQTRGLLVYRDKNFVCIASSVVWERDGGSWQFAGVSYIPLGMVRKIQRAT